MKLKSIDFNWILLLVAIALGGVAAFATKSYFEQREAELRAELSDSDVMMADVLVANQPLEKGMIISEQNMTVRQIRADIVPLEAYHPVNSVRWSARCYYTRWLPADPCLLLMYPAMVSVNFPTCLMKANVQ